MAKIIERLAGDTGKIEKYELVTITEEFKVKGQTFVADHDYEKRLFDGQLFDPHDAPDRNFSKNFNLYRAANGLLSPTEIVKIRQQYHLELPDFAAIIGIDTTELSEIENGSIQSKYINKLLLMAGNPETFKLILDGEYKNESTISRKTYEETVQIINKLT